MAQYDVDINLAIKGARDLKLFDERLKQLNAKLEELDRVQNNIGKRNPYSAAGKRVTQFGKEIDEAREIIDFFAQSNREAAASVDQLLSKQGSFNKFFQQAADVRQAIQASNEADRKAARQQRMRTLSTGAGSALIGGGFPLLFGQTGAAAAGGALGGLGGGLLGGQLGFALSIVGTALGQAVSEAEKFDKALAAVNSKAADLGSGAQGTAQDIKNLAEQFGVTKDEALELVGAFSEFEDFADKRALTRIFGDSSAAFDRLAAASTELDLAKEIFAARDDIGVAEAGRLLNALKITDASVIELALAESRLQAEHDIAVEKARQITLMDRLNAVAVTAGMAGLGGGVIDPAEFGRQRAEDLETQFLQDRADALERLAEKLKQVRDLIKGVEFFDPGKPAKPLTAAETGEGIERSLKRQLARYEEIEPFARKTAMVNADHAITLERIAKVKDATVREQLKELANTLLQARLDDIEAQKAEQRGKETAQRIKEQANLIKKKLKLQQDELKKAQELAKGLTNIVRDGFVDSIKAATDETRSLSDALANMLDRLSDKLLNLAANLAFYGNPQGDFAQNKGLFGTLLGSVTSLFGGNTFAPLMAAGGRYEGMPVNKLPATPPALPPLPKALGGAVGAGRPYMVGERGPELFVPGAQGNIVPNNAMGGSSIVVNVDASGSSVEGDSDQAAQLGKMLGAAVQAELVKQKRPGGILSS